MAATLHMAPGLFYGGHSFLRQTILGLHDACAHNPINFKPRSVPASAKPLVELLRASGYLDPEQAAGMFFDDEHPRRSRMSSSTRALIGFSGGKDSVSAALLAREKFGEVALFHIQGLNKLSHGHELEATQALSKMLDMQGVVEQCSYVGAPEWVENPLRNVLVAGLAAAWNVTGWNARHLALGTMQSHGVVSTNRETGFSDNVEVLDAGMKIIQECVDMELHHLLRNNTHSMLTLLDRMPKALPLVRSCLRHPGRIVMFSNTIKKRYGVTLMKGRCGTCSKCAGEWLHLWLTGHVQANHGYIAACVDNLVRAFATHYLGNPKAAVSPKRAITYFIDIELLPKARELY